MSVVRVATLRHRPSFRSRIKVVRSRLCLSLAFVLFCGCAVVVQPVAKQITPAKSAVVLNLPPAEGISTVTQIAIGLGARVEEKADGTLLVAKERIPASSLDGNCVYPVFDRKTGSHTYTFATWQMSVLQKQFNQSARLGYGDVLLQLSFRRHPSGKTSLEFSSHCVADTELGRLPAESTGVFEESVLNALFAVAGQQLSMRKPEAVRDSAAVLPYVEDAQLTADSHADSFRSLLPGVSDSTLVSVTVRESDARVWAAALSATDAFSRLTGRPVVRVDEQMREIQNGRIATDSVSQHPSWQDMFVTSLRSDGEKIRINVVRTLRISSRPNEWKGAPSDGELQSWIIGEVLRNLSRVQDAPTTTVPPMPSSGVPPELRNKDHPSPCTVAEILKMKDAGLSDARIKAACGDGQLD